MSQESKTSPGKIESKHGFKHEEKQSGYAEKYDEIPNILIW